MAELRELDPVLPVRVVDGILVFCCALLASCGDGAERPALQASAPVEVVDDAGRIVRLDSAARRVISLVPARTDAILALGAAHRLVARTAYDDDPRISRLPSSGDALTPSVEWLAALQPDLVIAWPDQQSRTVVSRLESLGIAVYASRVETLADVRRSIVHLGALLGAVRAADSLLSHIDSTLAAVRRAVQPLPRRTVFYVIGLDPPMAAGPGTFIDELIAVAGGTNVFADAGALWPPVSLEEALARQPDVVILSVAESSPERVLEQLRVQPGWRDMRAVREGRVYVVDPSIVNRPGPHVIDAARLLAELIHEQ